MKSIERVINDLLEMCLLECRECIKVDSMTAGDLIMSGCPHADSFRRKDCTISKMLKHCKAASRDLEKIAELRRKYKSQVEAMESVSNWLQKHDCQKVNHRVKN